MDGYIYICEIKLTEKKSLVDLISKIKNYEKSHDVKIFIDDYFDNQNLKLYYQNICIKCGIILNFD